MNLRALSCEESGAAMLVIELQQHSDVDDVSELRAYAVRAIEHDHWDRLLLNRALGQALSGLEVDIRQWAGSSGKRVQGFLCAVAASRPAPTPATLGTAAHCRNVAKPATI